VQLIPVQIDQNIIVVWQVIILVVAVDTTDVGARGIKRLNQAGRKHRNIDAGPLKRPNQVQNRLANQLQHGGMRGEEDNLGFGQDVFKKKYDIGYGECPE